ncbi:nucleotidyltransferase domain-containing protein [Sporolituus thermophilus]|uniref:Nucleotidyltransferase domain-containing protein n=1 Tax=Sporolituus thermophilus DSM 23256 TaxID=1123285 RepID=A0A1G7NBP2_9FIRM|nr:nucleotidyltransferase domain-containing protein [Sporolituus thermophilus]SDF71317.1 Nucleotidyltransferase domain-containing protein [Sporolituus thermophilus DSM 23256]
MADKCFGLTRSDMAYIVSVIQEFPEIKKAAIFGSRAKGNYKPGSDVDIAAERTYRPGWENNL